jgi:pyrroloquinoline quinone biosynthesis protein B
MTSIMVLGSGQDAGIPHAGCHCRNCNLGRRYERYRRLGPSISILDQREGYCYMIDASSDFKHQLDMVLLEFGEVGAREFPIKGIFLTHAHFGHVSGLWQLGKEVLDEKDLPVFCTPAMARFLKNNDPFRRLVDERNIELREMENGKELEFKGFRCMPVEVPHRNEIADTVGYMVVSSKKVAYIPDLDYWTDEVLDLVRESDMAIIDGTFFSRSEIARYDEIKHPPIEETVELLEDSKTQVYFTHINHTNPINGNGDERKFIEDKGFKVARDDLILQI